MLKKIMAAMCAMMLLVTTGCGTKKNDAGNTQTENGEKECRMYLESGKKLTEWTAELLKELLDM